MYSFICPVCGEIYLSVRIPLCLNCASLETMSTVGGNFTRIESEAPRQFGTVGESKNHSLPNAMQMAEHLLIQERKRIQETDTRNEAHEQLITHNCEDHEISRNEACGMTGQARPSCSRQGAVGYDTPMEISSSKSFDNYQPNRYYHEFRNTKESNSYNQAMKKLSNLKKTIVQNIASNTRNILSTRNKTPQNKISNCGASKGESLSTGDDLLAVPGPSGRQRNRKMFNSSEEIFPSRSFLELQSEVLRGTSPLCSICVRGLDRHIEQTEGIRNYKCCACKYWSSTASELQNHASIHPPKFLQCTLCGELNFDKDAHDREETCEVCKKKFQCRTLLEQHDLVHKVHYNSYCRVCGREYAEHIPKGKDIYLCCKCEHSYVQKYQLQIHLHTHTGLKIFKCHVCGRRFVYNNSLVKHLGYHFTCKICVDAFTSNERLEEHLRKHRACADISTWTRGEDG